MASCKNCGAPITDLYCGHCGQKAVAERITFHYIWHGLVHFFTHAEKGFFYSSVQMNISPGVSVISFLDGSRSRHQTPVSYFLIWNAIYILLLYLLNGLFGRNTVVDFSNYFGTGEKTNFALSHLNWVLLSLLPFQALYIYLVLMFRRYNYFEALVTVLFGIGTVLFWQFVFVTLSIPFYLLTGQKVNIIWSDIFKIIYIGWFISDLTRHLTIRNKLLKTVAVLILIFGTFTVWRLYLFPSVIGLLLR